MGEYATATVFKPVAKVTPLSNQFDHLVVNLREAGKDKKKIEALYREAGFVTERGHIFDLRMEFIEREGKLYQTNTGVMGADMMPDLSFAYKFDFPDFWMGILKPSEIQMDENNWINAELTGKEIRLRFKNAEEKNKTNAKFKKSNFYKTFTEKSEYQPAIKDVVKDQDLVQLSVGHIYFNEQLDYRDAARKSITEQRKKIANEIYLPHWAK